MGIMILFILFIVVLQKGFYAIAGVLESTSDTGFSKDVISLVVESTLTSKCNSNTFMTSLSCGNYISAAIKSLSTWAPPVVVTSFDENTLGIKANDPPTRRKEQWNRFLAWQRKTCSLILICDLTDDFDKIHVRNENDSISNISVIEVSDEAFTTQISVETTPVVSKAVNTDQGFLYLRKFITTFDNILYLYNSRGSDGESLDGLQRDYDENTMLQELQRNIIKRSGIILSIEVENRKLNSESLLRVFSKCNFCGKEKLSITDLGNWQRNRTQFSQFFPVFDKYAKIDLNGYNLTVGYFNYPPHFSMKIDDATGEIIYSGVEWQMLSQMGESLNFDFSLVSFRLSNSSNGTSNTNNITTMIEALKNGSIDLAVGGVSVTPERKNAVDFSKIFAHEPIVFVVAKRQDIYILGIWLAFQPQVWPLIIALIAIISLLFRLILKKPTINSRNLFFANEYRFLLLRGPIPYKSIGLFRALEITLTPLLGQALPPSQITKRPRRLLKVLLIIWWFSCLIISTLYNTSLITSLINPVTPKEPESLQDLIDFGYVFKLSNKPAGVVYELINSEMNINSDANEDGSRKTHETAKMIKLLRQIKDRMIIGSARQHSLVAYVVVESAVDEINWKSEDIGFFQIKIIRERLFLTGYGWPLQPTAPYKEKIDTALGRLASAGLLDYWYLNYSHKEKEPTSGMFRLRKKLGQIHVNMEILQGAFLFLFLGCGVASLVFGFEKFTNRYTFRFFTQKEIITISMSLWRKIVYYAEKISGEHRNSVVFIRNDGNTEIPNQRFREAVLEIVNIKKAYPYIK